MSVESDYLKWRNEPAIGCMFARMIAREPKRFDQAVERIICDGEPLEIAEEIDHRVTTLIEDQRVAAAVLLFPAITILERLARSLLALNGRPGWGVVAAPLAPPPAADMITVRLSRDIPFGDGTCPSEALVLGPFEEFAPTRRSPICALEMFVGQPRDLDPKTGTPTTKANLAHMSVHLPTQQAFERMWNMSMAGRLNSLDGNQDNRAKAKVSFVLPTALAQQLGCGT